MQPQRIHGCRTRTRGTQINADRPECSWICVPAWTNICNWCLPRPFLLAQDLKHWSGRCACWLLEWRRWSAEAGLVLCGPQHCRVMNDLTAGEVSSVLQIHADGKWFTSIHGRTVKSTLWTIINNFNNDNHCSDATLLILLSIKSADSTFVQACNSFYNTSGTDWYIWILYFRTALRLITSRV